MKASQLTIFVEDLFRLGPDAWSEKYCDAIPAGMTPQLFVDTLQLLRIEQQFIDKPDNRGDLSADMPCYLTIRNEGAKRVFVVSVDDFGHIVNQGTFDSLYEAMVLKAQILLERLAFVARYNREMKKP